MAKQKKGYAIRYYPGTTAYSVGAGRKLYTHVRAARLIRFLRGRYGVNAFAAAIIVQATAILAA